MASQPLPAQPWLFSRNLDLAAFGGSSLLAVALTVLGWKLGLLGALLHTSSSQLFWRVLAYLAVFHFVRQQVGWVALYQRKEPTLSSFDLHLDRSAVYAATLWPLLWWHGHLPRAFA